MSVGVHASSRCSWALLAAGLLILDLQPEATSEVWSHQMLDRSAELRSEEHLVRKDTQMSPFVLLGRI